MTEKRYIGLNNKAFAHARENRSEYVLSDVQINRANPRATGRRLSALEVAVMFGPRAVRELEESGAAVIQSSENASSEAIKRRLSELNLTPALLAERMEVPIRDLDLWLSGEAYFPIRKLERACFHLGLDEARVSAAPHERYPLKVRLRYYSEKRGDEHSFDPDLVFDIAEQAWKIRKFSFLEDFVRLAESGEEPSDKPRIDFIDSAYLVPYAPKPTVAKGQEIAQKMRAWVRSYDGGFRVVLSDVLGRLGVKAFKDEMRNAYCGMTVLNTWDKRRAVIANTVGKNAETEIMRFTLAHELAHAAFDPDDKFVPVRVGTTSAAATNRDGQHRSADEPEMRANSFAANFLAPSDLMREALATAPDISPVNVIRSTFGISDSAARWRLQDINVPSLVERSPRRMKQSEESIPPLNGSLKRIAEIAHKENLIHEDSLAAICAVVRANKKFDLF